MRKFVQIIKSNPRFYRIKVIFNNLFPIRGKDNNVVRLSGGGRIVIVGNNNTIKIGKNCIIGNIEMTLYGDNNYVIIHDGVCFYTGNILCEHGSRIEIGSETSIQGAHINAQEHSSIAIGKDCMFSANIIVRTSDSHPIYDGESGHRINPARSVAIGDHVWISAGSTILKGVTIGNGAIVGNGSIVTHDVPHQSIVAGIPAKVIKRGIMWDKKF